MSGAATTPKRACLGVWQHPFLKWLVMLCIASGSLTHQISYSSRTDSAVRFRGAEAGGEEERGEMSFGKRLEGMEENQLEKIVVDKLREDGGIGWWNNTVLRRKYELVNEVGSVGKLKNKIKSRNEMN